MPTKAGGTAAIGSDRLGNHVAELAAGRNSHGGGCCFAESVGRFRRGVFFVRDFDPYDEPMQALDESFPFSPTGWQAERSSSWDRVLKRDPRASRWETPTDPGRGVGSVMTTDSLLLGRTFQDRRSRVMWGLPGC